jgi:NADPH:quinone reductase-like Zn-dependent oxidoreductase
MKAVMCHAIGSPEQLTVDEIEMPVVRENEVLVRVRASSANPLDLYPLSRLGYLQDRLMGGFKPRPKPLGTDFAGTIESVGRSVKRFQPGEQVFGGKRGAFAEYVSVAEDGPLARKPANVTFEEAAAIPVAGLTALQALRDHGHLRSGQNVLINGASGGVGTFAVQLAKTLGGNVTGVCSTRNVEAVRALGADTVIDYTQADFTRAGQRYDLMLDIAGNRSWSECKRVLEPNSTFVAVGASAIQHASAWRALSHLASVRLGAVGSSQKVALFITKLKGHDLAVMSELVEAGRVSALIDRQYEFVDVPTALRYLEGGHAKAKIVMAH